MSRDYMMDDITSNWPDPARIVPGTKVDEHRPTDMPFTKDQALECIRQGACGSYVPANVCGRIYYVLCTENPLPPLNSVCAHGSHLGGWAYCWEDGWYGGYDTSIDAALAYEARKAQP